MATGIARIGQRWRCGRELSRRSTVKPPLVDQSFTVMHTHTDAKRLSDCFPYLSKQKQKHHF